MFLQDVFGTEVLLTRLTAESKRIIMEQHVLFKLPPPCKPLPTLLALIDSLVRLHVIVKWLFVLQVFLANFTLQLWLCVMNSLHVFGQLLHFFAADLALLQLHSMVVQVMPNTFFRVKNFPVQIALEFVDFSAFVLRLQVNVQPCFQDKL
jgi:hypothetical protein